MHVDGFRFDLAAALARQLHDVDRLAAFFDLVQQDPVISQVKLIAEPCSNNAYCQDSPLSWVDWENAAEYADLIDFTSALSALRRAHPVFRRRRFFSGRPAQAGPGGLRDINWLTPSGQEMTDADWHAGYPRSLAVFLNGEAITEPGPHGEPVRDAHFLLLFNAHSDAVRFVLPGADHADGWHVVVDTAAALPSRPGTSTGGRPAILPSATALDVTGRSVMVLRAADDPASGASPARTVKPRPGG